MHRRNIGLAAPGTRRKRTPAARRFGDDAVINYRTAPDRDAAARALTGGRGVDHILEVGGATALPTALDAVREGGHVTLVGLP